MAKYRAGSVARLTTPLRLWSQRFAFLLLMAVAVGLIIVSRAESPVAERIRTRVVDAVAPLLDAAAQPIELDASPYHIAGRQLQVHRRG